MTVVVEGMNELMINLDNLSVELEGAVSTAIRKTAIDVQKEVILSIREPSNGKIVTRYTDSGNPFKHTVSKEGDAPNTDTGRLINSIEMKYSTGDLFAFVFTNLEYGFFLETVHDRPFLQPALVSQSAGFLDNVTQAIKTEIKGV